MGLKLSRFKYIVLIIVYVLFYFFSPDEKKKRKRSVSSDKKPDVSLDFFLVFITFRI